MMILREFKNSLFRKIQRGFTLIEVLIVIVILGVLTGLAVPIYQAQVAKSEAQEALQYLQATRLSLQRYYSLHVPPAYDGASVAAASCNLDFCPNGTSTTTTTVVDLGCGETETQTTTTVTGTTWAGGITPKFDYTFSSAPGGNSYTLRAARKTNASNYITITAGGAIDRQGVYQ